MNLKSSLLVAILAVAVASMSTVVAAAERNVTTTISVRGMTCQGCANKLVKKLNAIPGVAKSQADAKKGVAVVVPKDAQRLPSPKAQWEAVEKTGYKPVRLAGPFGVFTTKPKF